MIYGHWALLFLGGFLAGVINAVAGGGALLIYPLLVGLGVSPIMANATTTVTVWPGALSSAYGYRKHLRKLPKRYYWLLVPCVTGGLVGAILLRRTPDQTFKYVVPWFITFAVGLLIIQPHIHAWLYSKKNQKIEKKHRRALLYGISLMLFVVSTYGGYFGAGFGIIMLAFLGLTELSDIQQMNGLKNIAAVSINLVASVYFIAYRLIDWRFVPLIATGCIIGGLVGSNYGAKLPKSVIRGLIIVVGISVAIILFIKL